MSLMGMVMIMCRSACLEVDEYDDKVNYEEREKDDNDDDRYSDEGKDSNFDWEESSYVQGSYASDNEGSVGNSGKDFQSFRVKKSYLPSYYIE
jgi:hypothetical protein